MGLLAGAVQEHVRTLTGLAGWKAARRFTVRSNFRYPVATIVLMAVIFAGTVVAIEKASSVAASLPRVNPQLPPITPLPYSLPQTLAVMFAITYVVAVVIWAVLHVLRRSGVHRLNDAETWSQK
jgi:heme A synthase